MSPAEFQERLASSSAEEREALFQALDDASLAVIIDSATAVSAADPEPTVRLAALRALARAGRDPRIVTAAGHALRDPDWRVQLAAVRLIASQDPTDAIPALVDCLGDPASPSSAAAKVLAHFPPQVLVPILLHRYAAESVMTRRAQIIALLGSTTGLEPYLQHALAHPEPVRTAAVVALGLRGDREMRKPLLQAVMNEDPDISALALEALAATKPDPADILQFAGSDNPDRRRRVASLLARTGGHQLDSIIRSLREAPDWRVREVCATALGSITDDRVPDLLMAATGDENLHVQQAAVVALGLHPLSAGSREADVVGWLRKYLSDPAASLKLSAARALLRIGSGQALAETLRYAAAPCQVAVMRAIGEATQFAPGFDAREIQTVLVELARAGHPRLAVMAADCLRALADAPRPVATPTTREWPPATRGFAPGEDRILDLAPPVPPPIVTPPSRVRYADAAFYEEGPGVPRRQWPNTEPLQFNHPYLLEIAIRDKRIGVPAGGPEDWSILLPEEDRAKLLVTADSATFEIEPKVATIIVPAEGNSVENAWFKVKPFVASAGGTNRMSIEVRIYYRFNLLESFTIEADVITGTAASASEMPIALVQRRLERPIANLEAYHPRFLNIDVAKTPAGYLLNFACEDSTGEAVALSAGSTVSPADLEDLVVEYRNALTNLTVATSYADTVAGGGLLFRDSIRTLAKLGRRAWNLLFPQANSPLAKIGRALRDTPLASGSILQVRLAQSADRFLFPWALVFDGLFDFDSKTMPDLDGFWGYRYLIEQQISTGDAAPVTDTAPPQQTVKVDFMLWNKFPNAAQQISMMQDYGTRAGGSLRIVGPLTDKRQFDEEIAAPDAQILYFYTHGHTRPRSASINQEVQATTFMATYEALPPDAPGRTVFADLYTALKSKRYELDDSWIELTTGRLLYDDLVDRQLFFENRPLVVLNMCESAQALPSFSESFIDLFLNAGAGAVLGTECLMTTEFAHPFSQALLDRVFAGDTIGQALLKARLAFREKRNPLGLAYTLFGSATLSFPPPRFKEQPAVPDSSTEPIAGRPCASGAAASLIEPTPPSNSVEGEISS